MARREASRWIVAVIAVAFVSGCGGQTTSSGNVTGSGASSAKGGGNSGRGEDASVRIDAARPACPVLVSDPSGKFTATDQQTWQANGGPNVVMITVQGGAVFSPLPTCSDRTVCPERDRMIALYQAENAAAQRCVRQLVAEVGGTVGPAAVNWLFNGFVANLTWPQIQTVATQPDVVRIEPNLVTGGLGSVADGGPR